VLPDDYYQTHPVGPKSGSRRNAAAQKAGWTRIQFCSAVDLLDELLAWNIYHTHTYVASSLIVGWPPGKNYYRRLPYLYEDAGKEPPPYINMLAEFGSWEHVKSVVEGCLKWNKVLN